MNGGEGAGEYGGLKRKKGGWGGRGGGRNRNRQGNVQAIAVAPP